MKNKMLSISLGILLVGLTAACYPSGLPDPSADGEPGQIWVANRGDSTISVIDAASNRLIDTLAMPAAGEPMYVNYSSTRGVVFVGDRANHGVAVYDAQTRTYYKTIPTGAGVFHQWALPDGPQLWVNNDVDRTTSVIDTETLELVVSIPMPHDLAAMPGIDGAQPKPHDVLLDPAGQAAFVSYVGFAGEADYVVRFDATTYRETHRAAVGKDPHLSATAENDVLYVPCQESDEVVILGRDQLDLRGRLPLPGAHGVGMAHGGAHLYVSNLPDAGAMALFVIDTETQQLLNTDGIDAPMLGKPHNLVLSGDDRRVFVTHSGADVVSVFDVSAEQPVPAGVSEQIRVGQNPFGLGLVPVGDPREVREYRKVSLDVSGLGTLRGGHHYEGWAIFDGQPVSTGKFNVDASGVATDLDGIAVPDGIFDAGRDLSVAQALVITVEVPGDVDITPNDSHYLAGEISGLGSSLRVTHGDALGSDFAEASGRYILATPTDGPECNETSGVWWVDPSSGAPAAGLSLPTLPGGWAYEGWVVIDGVPLSTGKFLSGDGADDDAPYSATDNPAPPFPGEDFLIGAPEGLSFPVDLSRSVVVVSIEPEPDDSADPFLLKPLVATAPEAAQDHTPYDMDNASDSFPVVTAILRQ